MVDDEIQDFTFELAFMAVTFLLVFAGFLVTVTK